MTEIGRDASQKWGLPEPHGMQVELEGPVQKKGGATEWGRRRQICVWEIRLQKFFEPVSKLLGSLPECSRSQLDLSDYLELLTNFHWISAKRNGGRDKDRTCDPYDVNVVLSR
jgi:hypothetical protein